MAYKVSQYSIYIISDKYYTFANVDSTI